MVQIVGVTPDMVVTEWSERCACGGDFLGHSEEPCRENCTGYYPVRWHFAPAARAERVSGSLVDLPDNVCGLNSAQCGCERPHVG